MLVLLPGCNICLPGDLKSNRKLHGVLDLSSCEQKTDVVHICTAERRYQDKTGKETFRKHSVKGFSLYLHFLFHCLWALGEGFVLWAPNPPPWHLSHSHDLQKELDFSWLLGFGSFQFLLGDNFWKRVENLWGFHNNEKEKKKNSTKFFKKEEMEL